MESPFEIPAQNLENWLGLDSHPVAVFLLRDAGGSKWTGFRAIRRHRYCQAVMWARRGHKVLLTGEQLVCPAAAAAFGFKKLPERLRSGKGLMGFGIVRRPETGRRMFEGMSRLRAHGEYGSPPSGLRGCDHHPVPGATRELFSRLLWLS